jgi:hypothetical protein
MFNFFKKKITDWECVWKDKGEFEIILGAPGVDPTAYYEIMYSPSARKFKLVTSGFNPKSHSMYRKACVKMDLCKIAKTIGMV